MKTAQNASIGAFLAGLLGVRAGECFCGDCPKPRTQQEWLEATRLDASRKYESAKRSLTILNTEHTREGQKLFGLSAGSILIGDEVSFHELMVYAESEQAVEFTLVHRDSRNSDKVYQMHGMESVESAMNSIQDALRAEAEAARAVKDAADGSKPEAETKTAE